jgi:hypothetical protein
MISLIHSTIFVEENSFHKTESKVYESRKGSQIKEEYENLVKEKMSQDSLYTRKMKICRNYTIGEFKMKEECSIRNYNINEIRNNRMMGDIVSVRKYSSYSENKISSGDSFDSEKSLSENIKNFHFKPPTEKKILFSVKMKELMEKIVSDRKIAINIIIKQMRSFLKIVKENKKIIIDKILKSRNLKITLIQKYFRGYVVHKHINEIRKDYDYVFFYNYEDVQKSKKHENRHHPHQDLANNKNINYINRSKLVKEIKLKFSKGKEGVEYILKYSKILNIYYLPFKKQGVMRKRFRVNFIVDGNTIIDPKYEVDNDKNGHFYNIIESSMFRKKKTGLNYSPVLKKIDTPNKFWENIFEIKINSTKEASSVSDMSEQNDTTIERLLNNIANIKPVKKLEKINLKPILKSDKNLTNLADLPKLPTNKNVKHVSFNEKVQFSY